MWSPEEQKRLKKLRIDPARHDRKKLIALVNHFKENGTLLSVTGKGLLRSGEEVHVSQGVARKLKSLTEQRQLEWLLGSGTFASSRASENDSTPAHKMRIQNNLRDTVNAICP